VIERGLAEPRRGGGALRWWFLRELDALDAWGREASELCQGQAAAFCSLAKLPLTQRRGAKLLGGSKCGIALTAIGTEAVFARAAYARIAIRQSLTPSVQSRREAGARVGSARRASKRPRRHAGQDAADSCGGGIFLDAAHLAAAVDSAVAIVGAPPGSLRKEGPLTRRMMQRC
jgi:hypothetical protein